MASSLHRSLLGLACMLLGCTMDNPAFGRNDIGDNESGDGDPTGPDSSGESLDSSSGSTNSGDGDGDPGTTNGDGDGDPSTSNGDGDGDSSTTDADCPMGTACGPCHVCDDVGACVPAVGEPCDGPKTHCAEYLYGSEAGTCYKLPDVVLDSRCDQSGQCKTAPASACPLEQGAVHFACEPSCVTSDQACAPFSLAANVDMAAMCAIDGPGPDCKTNCTNESASTIKNYACNFGECVYLGLAELCDPYACDEVGVFCYDSCVDEFQCAQWYVCSEGMCSL